ncbi:MAG TPA: helix-turn-helix transcriptional regulator [Solirubrobacter sp.]|nr:helix-turn-helix transcriptional regulator [Solirubrobacter sp.]
MSEIRHEPRARTVATNLAAGDMIDRHRHDDHQLVYVSTGVLVVQTAAGSWVASRDRAVWLPAGTWHQHRFYGASRLHTVGFPAGKPPLADPGPTVVAVSPLLRELLIACADPALAPREVQRVRAVIRDQLRRSPQQPITLPTPSDPRLVEACSIASERLDEPITLGELAQRVGAGERTLSRLFRHELGMTYPQWRRSVRLLSAAILLSGGASVTAAGQQCGFRTTSSFIEAFRRALGETPGAYRTVTADPRRARTAPATPPPPR